MTKKLSREEWLTERKAHLGASEVAAILGVDPRRGALAVYEQKVTGYSLEDNEWLAYGRDIEGAIANMYATKTGRPVEDLGSTEFQYHPQYPWLAATLDRVTQIPNLDATSDTGLPKPVHWVPLELKSVDLFAAKIRPKQWESDPPLHYQIQLQIQMACTGAQWGSLAGLFPGYQLKWIDIKRDDDFLEATYPILQEFWERVQNEDPPPADELPGTLDVVKRLWSQEDGTTLSFDHRHIELADEWEAAKSASKEAEKKAKQLETQLRAELKDATFGALPDGTLLSLKTTKNKGYTKVVKPFEYRTLRRQKVRGK